jgi:TrmH family RNA methyltransferase
VTSRRNSIVEKYRSIARGDTSGLLLDGIHLLQDALAAGLHVSSAVTTAQALERSEVRALVAELERQRIDVLSVSPAVMSALSPLRSPGAIVAIADERRLLPDAPYSSNRPLVLIACDVQDPGNLGAMVRVAEAGGASGLVAAGTSANPFGWKALRGAMGSTFRLPVVRHAQIEDAIAQARTRGCRVVATAPRIGKAFHDADLTRPLAILVGSEGVGIPEAILSGSDERLTVPMIPPVESLNAAVTAALIIYEARRQRS